MSNHNQNYSRNGGRGTTNPWGRRIGAGRIGRGSNIPSAGTSAASNNNNSVIGGTKVNHQNGVHRNRAEQKFLEAHAKLQANVKKHLNNEEYNDESSEEEELECDAILGSVLKSYSQTGGGTFDLGRTQKYLEDAFQSGAAICLICIATVKRPDAVWSCVECFCFFHVQCIQRWAKDSIAHQKQALEDRQMTKSADNLCWACPKCRKDYDSAEIPHRYYCFCGNTEDPVFQPWLVPHSCGDTCNKELQPKCGHSCLLLCHPGPCPPCPKTIKSQCYCGTSAKPNRCSNKFWSCGQPCGRKLACNRHTCANVCHEGICPPCLERSTQSCFCGNKTSVRECAEPQWQCDKVCNKKLDCGEHRCKLVCHRGDCGTCLLSLERNCPCGKSQFLLPCTEDTPTCSDTCGKTLDCGQHKCFQRCHYGKCGLCVERIVKLCRCRLHSKEVPCTKEYLCETKCKRIRDCNFHPCNRKCCDANCPPCEKPCGKTLNCGNHKCQSVCHRGLCYPCPRTVQVSCRCGSTTIVIPCGRGVRSKRPRCNKPCKIPPDCHHPARTPHNCHFDACPDCKQVCGIKRDLCGHSCKALCHSAMWVDVNQDVKPKGPWDKVVPQYELRSVPCRPCPEPISVTCLGGHETYDLPCHRAFSSSCERPCGRALSCGNHVCQLKCHVVLGAENEQVAGQNCEPCEKGCELSRPPGCVHKCPHACHLAPCPPCMVMLRLRCHCSLNQLFVRCGEHNSASADRQREMLTCNNQCPKNLPCGHRCTATCHSGDCPNPEMCKQKVKLTCPCHRIKKDYRCYIVRADEAVIVCDDACKSKAQEERQKQELLEKKQKELEELKNKEELEKFQKKFQGRKKHRERRLVDETDKTSFIAKHWPWLAASGSVGLAVIIMYWL